MSRTQQREDVEEAYRIQSEAAVRVRYPLPFSLKVCSQHSNYREPYERLPLVLVWPS